MSAEREQALGGANDRPMNEVRPGGGPPDEAGTPGEFSRLEGLSLSRDPQAEAMARKLAEEVRSFEARRAREER